MRATVRVNLSVAIVLLAAAMLVGTTAIARASAVTPAEPVAAPTELASQLAEARRLMRTARHDAARPILARAAAAPWPCRDLALLLLAECQIQAGEHAAAIASARLVAGLSPPSARLADAAWLEADALKASRSAEAAAAYRSFASRWPADERAARAVVLEAESLEQAGLAADAAIAWRRAMISTPALAPADARERALGLARRAGISLAPVSAAERLAIAEALARANHHERAAEAWVEAARGASGEAAARCLVERARSLYHLRRNDAVRETCESALRDHPRSPIAAECTLLIARAASRQGDGATIHRMAARVLDDARWKSAPWRHDLAALRAARLLDEKRFAASAAASSRLAREASGDRAVDAAWKAAWSLLVGGDAAAASTAMGSIARSQDLDTEVGRNARLWQALALEVAQAAGQPREDGRGGAALSASGASPIDLLAELSTARPWSYCGLQARELLAPKLSPDALAALDAEALDAGIVFEDPAAPALGGPHGERYVLLRDAGLHADALVEIDALRSDASPRSAAFTFELARASARAGLLARSTALLRSIAPEALRLPSRRSSAAFWEIIYPRPYGEIVDSHSARAGLDPAFCSAIVRAESAWRPEVRSTADARGLMQLIPSTATRVARQAGQANFDAEQLFDPDVNVRLGSLHLAGLIDVFDGDMAAAAASYNAGEMKVAEWWASHDARGIVSAVERIESIPFRETRVYVKRVLEATAWYRWLARCDEEPQGPGRLASGQ